jgi:hypothetical protein
MIIDITKNQEKKEINKATSGSTITETKINIVEEIFKILISKIYTKEIRTNIREEGTTTLQDTIMGLLNSK